MRSSELFLTISTLATNRIMAGETKMAHPDFTKRLARLGLVNLDPLPAGFSIRTALDKVLAGP
jgi:hypothetical protein